MKHIEISDDAYRAIASQHGDVAAFVERIAKQQPAEAATDAAPGADPARQQPARTFYDAALESGMIGRFDDLPPDLSTNPKHLEGFGR